MLREDNIRTGFFEPEQSEAVWAHLPAHLRPLVTFMYLTGWRKSEVVGLEWRQVDLKSGTVTLDPGTTKNDEGRVFPFTSDLRELLASQGAERDRLRAAGHLVPWVFFRLVGTRGDRETKTRGRSAASGSTGSSRVGSPVAPAASRTIFAARQSAIWCALGFPSASR